MGQVTIWRAYILYHYIPNLYVSRTCLRFTKYSFEVQWKIHFQTGRFLFQVFRLFYDNGNQKSPVCSYILKLNALLDASLEVPMKSCYSSYGLEPGGTACTLAWWINDVFYVSYVITVFLICFVLPICIMTVCYYKAIRFITWVGDGGQQENLEWTNEKDITKVWH